jgi:ParB/RepB/Spo0J family partition protein
MAVRDKGRKAVEKHAQRLTQLSIEYVPVDSITPNSYNPNRQNDHDFELLLRSMEEDGFTQPIICQRGTRQIVDGEHRWRAATQLGFKEIPVVFTDMTPEQMKIATLRHNRARGSEDMELSAQVLRDLQELGALEWAQDSLMLDDTEIERLLNDVDVPEVLAGEQYSQAWMPVRTTEGEAAHAQSENATEAREVQSLGSTAVTAMTQGAADSIREREKKLAAAKSEEEKRMISKDDDNYRVFLVFSGAEAKTVKSALGDRPAEMIVRLCAAYLEDSDGEE